MVKPGHKTTEFWLSLAAFVAVNVGAALSEGDARVILLAIGNSLIAAGYSLSRGNAKAGTSVSVMNGDLVNGDKKAP